MIKHVGLDGYANILIDEFGNAFKQDYDKITKLGCGLKSIKNGTRLFAIDSRDNVCEIASDGKLNIMDYKAKKIIYDGHDYVLVVQSDDSVIGLRRHSKDVVIRQKFKRIVSFDGNSFMLGGMSGRMYCWGENSNGVLGVGDDNKRKFPVLHDFSFKNVKLRSCYAFGLNDENEAYSWGTNELGCMGLLDVRFSYRPVKMGHRFKRLICDYYQSFAFDMHDNIWCWGNNHWGQFGIGDNISSNVPIVTNHKFEKIYVAGSTVFAIAHNHDTYAWGCNGDGELAFCVGRMASNNMKSMSFNIPVKLKYKFKSIKLGIVSNIAVDVYNDIYSWRNYNCDKQPPVRVGKQMIHELTLNLKNKLFAKLIRLNQRLMYDVILQYN